MRPGGGGVSSFALSIGALVVALSCYDPRFKSCATRCGLSGECPAGLVCKAGYCASTQALCPTSPDGSPPADQRRTDAGPDRNQADRASGGDRAADVRGGGGGDATADGRRDAVAADRPDALRDGHATDGPSDRRDGASDRAGDGRTADAGTDAARTDAGADHPGRPLKCPERHYLNVARQTCVPAHDLNGDGRADLLAVNSTDMQALLSTGTSFTKAKWFDGAFYGVVGGPSGGTFAADVTGTGFAAGIAFGDTFVAVVHTSGPGFGSWYENVAFWFINAFWGTRGTFLADVNDDGAVDMLAVNDRQIDVSLSTTYNFQMGSGWLDGDFTVYTTFFVADVDGDGAADVVATRPTSVDVFSSVGTGLLPAKSWRPSGFSGSAGTFFADVDGDGAADGVRVEQDGVWVALSTRRAFADDVRWFQGAILGDVASFVADADGDGRADFIAVNGTDVRVNLSTGASFLPASTWYTGRFAGAINTTVAPAPSSSCGTGPPP